MRNLVVLEGAGVPALRCALCNDRCPASEAEVRGITIPVSNRQTGEDESKFICGQCGKEIFLALKALADQYEAEQPAARKLWQDSIIANAERS